MPPKSKITKEMITEAAYRIVRENGEGSLNARTIAERLGCSTQPVLYYFKTMEDIRKEVYIIADNYHSEYLMKDCETGEGARSIWKNYIKFSVDERHLFKFLFQSNNYSGRIQSLFEDERMIPVYEALGGQFNLDIGRVKKIFAAIYYPIHGIASLLANNSMEYNEKEYETVIDMIRKGVLKELENNEITE